MSTMCLLSIHNCDPHGLFPNTCLRNRSLLRDQWEEVMKGGGRRVAWRDRASTLGVWRERESENMKRRPVRRETEMPRSASRFRPRALSEFTYGIHPSPCAGLHPFAYKKTRSLTTMTVSQPWALDRRRTLEGTRTRETPRTERAREAERASRTHVAPRVTDAPRTRDRVLCIARLRIEVIPDAPATKRSFLRRHRSSLS